MGILNRFEQRLEGAVRGGFAKVFGGALEPVEIAAALQREAEAQRVVVSAGRTVAPNAYAVALSPSDADRLLPWSEPLSRELAALLTEHVQDAGWQFYGPVVVVLSREEHLDTGVLRVTSEVDPDARRWTDHPPTTPPPPAQVRGPRDGRPRLVVPDPRAPGGRREHELTGGPHRHRPRLRGRPDDRRHRGVASSRRGAGDRGRRVGGRPGFHERHAGPRAQHHPRGARRR